VADEGAWMAEAERESRHNAYSRSPAASRDFAQST
jgi:hypothetical protein